MFMKNKILILGLAVVMLASVATAGFPVTAQAAGLTQQQINAVMTLLQAFGADQSVINNVQTALTGGPVTPPTPTAWCYTFNNNLRVGSVGNDTIALLTALEKEGFSTGQGQRGVLDEALASSVVGFQEKYASEILTPNGLTHGTGFVGASTRAKLNSLYGCNVVRPPSPQPSITVSSSGTDVIIDPTLTSTSNAIFTANVAGGSGQYKYYWSFGDGNISDGTILPTFQGNQDVMGHRYTAAGTYYLSVYVVDSNGKVSNKAQITVNARLTTQPSITILSPNGGESFTPSVSSPNMLIQWSNPSGFTSTNSTVTINLCSVGNQTTTCPATGSTNVVSGLSNTGQYQAVLLASSGSASPAGRYIVNILATRSDGVSAFGSSANSFTITSPLTTTNLPVVTTKSPTNITSNSAVLNGELVSNFQPTTMRWFEYKTDNAVGGTGTVNTSLVNQGQSGIFATNITNLQSHTTYYFRVCSYNTTTTGTYCGSILSFQTLTPIAQPSITLSANQIATSDAQPRSYTVTWSATGATSCVLATNATKDTEDFDFWSGYIGPVQNSGSITAQVYSGATVTITCTGSGGTSAKSVNLIGNAATSSLTPEMISAMTAFSQQNNLNTANVLRAVEQLMKAFR